MVLEIFVVLERRNGVEWGLWVVFGFFKVGLGGVDGVFIWRFLFNN